ncbi:MAG: hypothetical protein H6767_05565 [Candidatus Peribacteria bacterium]|nr:MAG: hypothetical protein H6767_05565 [Candidatus Peribacteria bacterium]
MSYSDLINVDDFGEKRENFNEDRGEVSFYCKECKKLVTVTRPNPKGYTFVCEVCKSKDVVIGTKEGLITNYKIKA